MKYLLPFLFLLCFENVPTDKETILKFDIVRNNRVMGSLDASRTVSGTETFYKSLAKINTRVIRRIKVDHKYKVDFENGFLQKADVRIKVNERLHAKTITKWRNSGYRIAGNRKNITTLTDKIDHATVLLYFEEPVSIKSTYSEQEASFNSLVPLGNHTYKKINLKGRENIYHYENGVLKRIEVDGGLIKFEMVARD